MIYSLEDLPHLFLENPAPFESIYLADLEATKGKTLFVMQGTNIVFACDMDERWQTWCQRQRHVDPDWNYEVIEHPHFCKVMERWVRWCRYFGASEGRTGLPRRMRKLAFLDKYSVRQRKRRYVA